MAIYFYSKTCEGCRGNQALSKMKSYCKKQGIEFQERRIILWERYEQESNEIMELNEGLKLPFFYETESGKVLAGNSLTPLDTIETWIKNAV